MPPTTKNQAPPPTTQPPGSGESGVDAPADEGAAPSPPPSPASTAGSPAGGGTPSVIVAEPPKRRVGDAVEGIRLWLSTLTTAVIVALSALAIGQYFWAQQRAEWYRGELDSLQEKHDELRGRFNKIVAKTAVTDVIVEGGTMCVAVRNALGEEERIGTDFDPTKPIHFDYVIADGRLLIRRIYDDDTAPSGGLLINSDLADLDWKQKKFKQGITVYRQLSEGRWTVSVTGNGALDLRKRDPNEIVELEASPRVVDGEEIKEGSSAANTAARMGEAVKRAVGGGK